MRRGRTGGNRLIRKPLKEVDAKIRSAGRELTVSPWQSRLGRESSAFGKPGTSCGDSSRCSQHQEPCGAVAYSPDATVLGTAWMENKWKDHFFLQRPPSLNARRHNREEIPWRSCNPVYRIWPHKYTPCSNPVYENDGCHILFFATHQKQSSGGFPCWESCACCPSKGCT